jgi:lysophospholipase L1-like esterase
MPDVGKPINTRALALLILAVVLCLELILRSVSYFELHKPFWDDRKYVHDEHLIWKLNPGYKGVWNPLFDYLAVNSLGLVGAEPSVPKPKNVRRIMVVGGSVTFGFGIHDPDSTSFVLLGSLLNARGDGLKYEMLNASAPGYSSYNGRKFTDYRLGDLNADALIIAFGSNDGAHDTAPDKDPQKDWSVSDMSIRGAVTYSYILQWIEAWRQQIKPKITKPRPMMFRSEYPFRVPLDDFRENMTAIVNRCRELGVQPILLCEPHPHGTDDPTGKIALHHTYQEAIRALAQELKVPLADADSVFQGYPSTDFYPHPETQIFYPTVLGQLLMADVLYKTLEKAGCLPNNKLRVKSF